MPNNYTKRGSSGSKNSSSPKLDQSSNPMVSKNINSKVSGVAPPPGFEKNNINNRRSSAGSWNGGLNGGGLMNGWEHSNGDSSIRRSLGNNFGKYNGYSNRAFKIVSLKWICLV